MVPLSPQVFVCIIAAILGFAVAGNMVGKDSRRKFRSQTSDNMDRWNSRGGKSQTREEQKREDQRRERVRRKKMQVREKVGKSQFTMFSNDLWRRRVEKVGSLKRREQSHLAR